MRRFKVFGKKGQSGQSLVILALGFLALLGFVGIVTDVSVLFIRYNTMRRAVDAAAVAAAGQMRRVADPTPLDGNADDEAISVANLNLAARQFIEVYGLNPKNVLVETCRAQNVARDANGNPLDGLGRPLFNTDGTDNYNDGTKLPEPDADPEVIKSYKQLCTSDELKLVRVTAQIDAPTIFLRLLGYPTVTLTETAISQTAVIDVVLIFDVSESMLNETTYTDWDTLTPKQGVRFMPPFVDPSQIDDQPDDAMTTGCVDPYLDAWQFIADRTQAQLTPYITPSLNPDPCLEPLYTLFRDKTIAFEPCAFNAITCPNGFKEWTDPDGNLLSDQNRAMPRAFCQVRAYSITGPITRSPAAPDLRQDYYDFFQSSVWQSAHLGEGYAYQFTGRNGTYRGGATIPTDTAYFSGFVPMYNSFACCNDPNGDFAFDDLICQPFKEARDAAHEFLDRLDFLRGDRVAYVTFNRQAYLVDPDGADKYDPGTGALIVAGGPQAAMIETQYNLSDSSGTLLRRGAVETLNDLVGVMAEPSTYRDEDSNGILWEPQDNDGRWSALNDGGAPRSYDQLMGSAASGNVIIGDIINNPVNGACPTDKALTTVPYLSTASQLESDGAGGTQPRTRALLENVLTVPQWYYAPPYNGTRAIYRSYENRALCGQGNIGGALAAGSAALFTEGRREGAVWIMVMLSDGGAGASNPITRINGSNIAPPQPYAVSGSPAVLTPIDGVGGPICTDPASPNYPCPENSTGGYGFYGLCPYGPPNPTSGDPTNPQLLLDERFPWCSDLRPETRHYCGAVAAMPDGSLDQDTSVTGCINYYDTDDYARDWADWIAVAELPNAASGGTTGRVGDQLLPTVFTIGFGFNYTDGQGVNCLGDVNCERGLVQAGANDNASRARLRTADYLGEELLRYIADVGDNFQIDNDYWQLHASVSHANPTVNITCNGGANDRIANCIDLNLTSPDWGVRGACENPPAVLDNTRGNTFLPKPPQESCGNYYWAATGQQLEDVFNQIASRMFTRLSQ